MPARVARGRRESCPPNGQGFLRKDRPRRVRRDLRLSRTGEADGQPVNIPAPPPRRYETEGGPRRVGRAGLLDTVRPWAVGVWG